MGKIYFLNEQARKYHKDNNIITERPEYLKLVHSKPEKSKKPKRKTLGQRIYEKMQGLGENDDVS